MEQQKITQNLQPNSQSNTHIADISNTYQKTLKSLHNISNSNIKSKPKLGSGPQFVISYNFQNDPNCQVRTHNLLIGLSQVPQSHSKKNTFRKNAILRSNHISNSQSNLKNSRNQSQHMRNKLIHVRSNEILSSKHQQPDTTVQSFYTKNSNSKNHPQSFTHGNTFWKDEGKSVDQGRKNHQQKIISNVEKIAHRRSQNKNKSNVNVYTNSIQKISRNKLNGLDKTREKQIQAAKPNSNFIYEFPDTDLLEKDQTSTLTKRPNKDENYNQKLQNILRKVKREKTKSDLKQAYVKQQPSFTSQQTFKGSNQNFKAKFSPSKMSPKSRTIHENEVEKLTSFIQNHKSESQQQLGRYESQQKTSFDQMNPLKNPQNFNQLDPVSRSILNHQRGIIEKENTQKPKRKYRQLIKNANKSNKNSSAEEFHRIESENQNEMGSSKKESKNQILENNLPDKSFNQSINGHLEENQLDLKEAHTKTPQENHQEIVLQKLELNKKESNKEKSPQYPKSTNRNNYHAPTAYQRNPNESFQDRKRLNSNIDPKSNTFINQKEDGMTKRKVPADYKQFLRMLSEQNDKRKQFEEMQRERQLSLNAQKTSRFQNLEEQNEHIKRVLTPIRNSFMEERRKRLSQDRKSKRKMRKQQKLQNADGSIIQSDSESSSDDETKNYRKKQLKTKIKNKNLDSKTNSETESISKTRNFREQLKKSIQRMKKQSKTNSPKKSSLAPTQKDTNQNKLKAKLNSVEFSDEDQKDTNNRVSLQANDEFEKQHQNVEKIQKLTGMKIPQKAIERAKSKRLLKRAGDQKSENGPQGRESKKIQDGNTTQNNFSKNKNVSKAGKGIAGQRQSQQLNENKELNSKYPQNKKIKPVDKRNAQDKQRKFKNWNESELSQKEKKEQRPLTKNGKKANQKDWKNAQKDQKDKKSKNVNRQQHDDESQQQQSNQNQNTPPKNQFKKPKKTKKTVLNENGEPIEVKQSDGQESDEQSENVQSSEEGQRYEKHYKDGDPLTLKDAGIKNIDSNLSASKKQDTENIEEKLDKNEISPNAQRKELVASIHDNVLAPETKKNEQEKEKISQNAYLQGQEQRQNRVSQSVNLSNKASIQQVLKSDQTQNFSQEAQNLNVQNQPQRQTSTSNHTQSLSKQMAQEKKQEMIQNVIQNQEMKQNGFMEISESKFDIYNHESDKSVAENVLQPIQQMDSEELEKRAEIVRFLYSLPAEYQKEVSKFLPNETSDRLLTPTSFTKMDSNAFKNIKTLSLRNALEELTIFDHLNPKFFQHKGKTKYDQPPKNNFLKKIFEPYQSLNGQFGVWIYCVGVWRLITVDQTEIRVDQTQSNHENVLFVSLEKAFQKALKTHYPGLGVDQIKQDEILRMLTGLRISILVKNKGKTERVFKQIEYNIRKNHIIRAFSSLESKFAKETINCVRKIENTPTGQKVLQIVSTTINQIQLKPKYFWIREDKFLQFFTSFTIISRRSTDSYWTNDSIKIKNQEKAVYMIDSTQKHTSGSITLYPLDFNFSSNKQKCTIAFYKQIEPQVLKLVGKAIERLPESKETVHTSKLYFEFNIRGTYYVFLELENGLYNVAIESNSPQMRLNFVEYVKKETNKNQQCEYVEIDKIFKKKPNINTFQNSNEFKQLMNFMKKTSPQIYQAK